MQLNLLEVHQYVKLQNLLGLGHCVLPAQGTFRIKDDWELKVVCMMVLQLLDWGKNLKNIQFDTVKKKCAHASLITAMQVGML